MGSSICLKCPPKFATGTSSQGRWKQLVPHQVRCTSAPRHWQMASSIQCPRASLKLRTAFPLWLADVVLVSAPVCPGSRRDWAIADQRPITNISAEKPDSEGWLANANQQKVVEFKSEEPSIDG